MRIQKIADDIQALKLHPAPQGEYNAGYHDARYDAWLIVQNAIDETGTDALPDSAPDIDPIEVIKGFLAWSEEPDPSSASERQKQLCKVWSKARAIAAAALSTPTSEP